MTDAALAERLAAATEALCAVASPIGHEEALCGEVERRARAHFPDVRRVKNSLVVWVDAATGTGSVPPEPFDSGRDAASAWDRLRAAESKGERPLVLLCGHLDTVPVPPVGPRKAPAPRAGRPRRARRLGHEERRRRRDGARRAPPRAERFCNLALVLYSREEGPFDENELGDVLRETPGLARAALALCLEPTDGVLQLGCVGSIHATVTFTGRAAHSARPWQGENAIHKAGALLAHLATRPPRDAASAGVTYREVVSATRVDGGRARNVVPERCTMNLNFRFAPDKTLEAAAEELRALAAGFGGAAELTDLSPAFPPSPTTRWCSASSRALASRSSRSRRGRTWRASPRRASPP